MKETIFVFEFNEFDWMVNFEELEEQLLGQYPEVKIRLALVTSMKVSGYYSTRGIEC